MARVAAITGASAGIGRATAEHLARLGMAVALFARRADRLDEIAGAIRAGGGQALAVAGDVTREADVQALVDRAVSTFGRLDVMIANAGIGFHGGLDETTPEVMRRLLDVNFMGTYHAARAVVPVFRRQASGHLIVISSIAGRRGVGLRSAYCATKTAQAGFAESLRVELAPHGISVSVVFPVFTTTEFHDVIRRDFGRASSGVGTRQSADDVARAIVRCVQRPRGEVHPHWTSRGLAILNALAPALADRFIGRFARREQRELR